MTREEMTKRLTATQAAPRLYVVNVGADDIVELTEENTRLKEHNQYLQQAVDILVEMLQSESFYGVQKDAVQWASRTFPGHHLPAASGGILTHLVEEAGELQRAWAFDLPNKEMHLEAADVLILLMQFAYLQGIDLMDAVKEKMAINKKRRWGPAQENGVVHHVKEEEENDAHGL